MKSHAFTYVPKGPFNLLNQNNFFGGWEVVADDGSAVVLAFPVEGWEGSAAVVLRQNREGEIEGEVHAEEGLQSQAKVQALAALSLDVDATLWPEVALRDPFIGLLQKKYEYLRPELFHSPYEAAAHFIIGHRISMKQGRAIRQKMAQDLGVKIKVGQKEYAAFPAPEVVMNMQPYPGLNEIKMDRLRSVAEAAMAGLLNREYLRSLPTQKALNELETLPGVGPFFSQGILHRGAGLVDEVTDDDISKYGIKNGYNLSALPSYQEVISIAEDWRPFRMWATVLIHVWVRRELGMPEKRTFTKK